MWQNWKQTDISRIATALAVGLLALGAFTFPGTAHHHEHPPEPYVVTNEWSGFIECGVGTLVLAVAVCSVLESPNDDFLLRFETDPGIHSVVIAMDWDPVGGISSPELALLVDVDNQQLAEISGPPPLEVRIDDLPADGAELRFRVFAPSDGAAIVYQQPFTVYHDHFYHAPAPDGYSALPDPHEH